MGTKALISTSSIAAFAVGALLFAAPPAAALQASAPILDVAPEPLISTAAPPASVPVPLISTAAPPASVPVPRTIGQADAMLSIDLYYAARSNSLVWFRDAATREAASMLPAILRRGQIEGLANAAELALGVEAAIERAGTPLPPPPVLKKGAPPAPKQTPFLAEDKMLSAAWVRYVRALHGPQPEMSFGDAALAPKAPLSDRILHEAQKAPSLARHILATSNVNPVYARLRDLAWKALRPDPQLRLVSASDTQEPALTNLRRARLLPATGRFIVVNLDTAKLWMFEDGRASDSMKVIIGKAGTATPMLAGTIHYATLNPYWNIPSDVTRRVVAPLVIKRGVSYLKAARYEVASDWTDEATVVDPGTIDWKAVANGTTEIRVRQLPGAGNMMGAIKFGFDNAHGIYLHDTPRKELFAKARRLYSLGCVRVEDAQRLAGWLFGGQAPPQTEAPEQHLKLGSPVPVFLTHLTVPEEMPADAAELTSAIVDPAARAPGDPGSLTGR